MSGDPRTRMVSESGWTEANDAITAISGPLQDGSYRIGRIHPLAQDLLFNPEPWRLWPAVAILRWMLRDAKVSLRGLIYRSRPALSFSSSEISDIVLQGRSIDLILAAPGLAGPGSALPTCDVAKVIAETRRPGRGAIAAWLDAPLDRFMQAVEAAEERHSAAFALATGGEHKAIDLTAEMVGRSAPLRARPGARLSGTYAEAPVGAVGLAALFVGPISAAGLSVLVRSVTGLPTTVSEFTGARVQVFRPARLGASFGRVLGTHCHLAAAGVDVEIDGGEEPEAGDWARSPVRRRALTFLCASYVGGALPEVRVWLTLAGTNVEPARLGVTTLGGLAVLGRPSGPVRLAVRSE